MAEAAAAFEAGLSMHRAHLGATHERTYSATFNLGKLRWQLGETGQARELLAQAADGARQALGAEHERVVKYVDALADIDADLSSAAGAASASEPRPPSVQASPGSGGAVTSPSKMGATPSMTPPPVACA